MKKTLSILGIILPFVCGIAWLAATILLIEISPETTNVMISLGYVKMISLIGLIVGVVTFVISIIYMGRKQPLAHKDIIPLSWKFARKNIWKFALGLIVMFTLQFIQEGISDPERPTTLIVVIVSLVVSIAYLGVDFGMRKISLSILNEKKTQAKDIFVDYFKFLKYLVSYVIMTVFSLIGMFFLIVPGVIISLRLTMVPYLLIEKKISPWKAITESWKLTKGYAADIFVINIVLGCINIVGFLALFVGLFWTIPTFYLANAKIYQKLVELQK